MTPADEAAATTLVKFLPAYHNTKVLEVPIVGSQGEQRSVNVEGIPLKEEVIVQEDDDANPGEVTYYVEMQDGEGGETRQVIMTQQQMMEHLEGSEVVYEDLPGHNEEGEEYAVLMLPPGENAGEPEAAALSMLQLQQSTTTDS
jgi:hypothetical protein